jgi:LysM repeat protein
MHPMRRRQVIFVLVLAALLTLLCTPYSVGAAARIHVVQRGENLTAIARRYGTSVSAIMQANGLSNRNFVWVGQRLSIPGTSSGSSSSSGGGLHIVQRGENLTSIARRYGTSVSAFMQANGLTNRNFVWVGQRLRIPGGSSGGSSGTTSGGGGVHIVQRGENLTTIARRYGTSVSAFMQANGLTNRNFVWVGQRLKIPSGSSGGSSSSGGSGSTGSRSGRWIEIDLSSQRTMAWQGSALARSMVVSTGISRYPTPTGTFRIYSKYPSVTMSGPGYYLPGVPHTMFFYRGYAIHGTYWHSNFGHPMSHGCINLTRNDAAWLYSWASVGTSVVIHW